MRLRILGLNGSRFRASFPTETIVSSVALSGLSGSMPEASISILSRSGFTASGLYSSR